MSGVRASTVRIEDDTNIILLEEKPFLLRPADIRCVSMQGAMGTTGAAVDQQCSTIDGSYLEGLGVYQPVGQTFIPAQSLMTGFALYRLSDNPTAISMTTNIVPKGVTSVDRVQGRLSYQLFLYGELKILA